MSALKTEITEEEFEKIVEETWKEITELVRNYQLLDGLEKFVIPEELCKIVEEKLQALSNKIPPNHPLTPRIEEIYTLYENLREIIIKNSENSAPEDLLLLIKLNEELSSIMKSLKIREEFPAQ